jgi:IMP dehydrogenase
MQAVTGVDMAISLAQLGGIGILPVSQPVDEQCAKVNQVKRFKAGFQTNIVTLAPKQSIADVAQIIRETGYDIPRHAERRISRQADRYSHRQGLRRAS